MRDLILDWFKGDVAPQGRRPFRDQVGLLGTAVDAQSASTVGVAACDTDDRRRLGVRVAGELLAVISAVVVAQSSLGGTLGASRNRLMATVAWRVRPACSFAGPTPLPELLVLTLAVGPTALLAALRPYRDATT